MLVLTRKVGEAIILETTDGPIKIMITKKSEHSFKFGIDAPKSVLILREELLDRERKEDNPR